MWIEKTARRIAQSTGLARTIRKIRPTGSSENERGFQWARQCKFEWSSVARAEPPRPNPLQQFFETRKEGPGIFKWNHYFDIYQHHFEKFRGDAVHILEIGVYSGGSLEMWRDYFGPESRVYGVDIEPACRAYERDGVQIFIGDQADRTFWRDVRNSIPALDIVIDDGGHAPEQQIVTLEELLPFIRPGGVYLCEDVHVHHQTNRFAAYVYGLSRKLNDASAMRHSETDAERRMACECNPFQSAIGAIHLYPYVTVIERNISPVTEFVSPKRGSQWEPFFT